MEVQEMDTKRKILESMSKVAFYNAKKEANSACILLGYQPKMSKEMKAKLKSK